MSKQTEADLATVRIPIAFRKRGSRKLIVAADESQVPPNAIRTRVDNTLLKAVVQAFRWKAQLDAGICGTISELAGAEKLNTSYVSHQLRLTLLAPDLVEAILDRRQPPTSQLQPLMRNMPVEWVEQRALAAGTLTSS